MPLCGWVLLFFIESEIRYHYLTAGMRMIVGANRAWVQCKSSIISLVLLPFRFLHPSFLVLFQAHADNLQKTTAQRSATFWYALNPRQDAHWPIVYALHSLIISRVVFFYRVVSLQRTFFRDLFPPLIKTSVSQWS